jgi:hypothetical protein
MGLPPSLPVTIPCRRVEFSLLLRNRRRIDAQRLRIPLRHKESLAPGLSACIELFGPRICRSQDLIRRFKVTHFKNKAV